MMPSASANEKVEDAFVHPFIETVLRADGSRFFRTINVSRDRVQDYMEGKTACIMTNDGTPLSPARQDAFMAYVAAIAETMS
jgi:hypothetical protein